MLSFQLDDEQREIVALAGRIAREKFKARALEWGRTREFPRENIALLREVGLLGITIDPRYGGAGRSPLDSVLVTEAIGAVCPTTASVANTFDLGPTGTLNFLGSEDQKQRYLPRLARGELRPSISLSEPEAGSALTELRTSGVIEGDACIINGHKIFCSRADTSDIFFVYARFGAGSSNVRCVIVERGTPGLTIGEPNHFMSGDTWAPLYFDNCRVPSANVLPTDRGLADLLAIYSIERTAAAAKCLGIAQCALNLALEHARTRRQFGKPLAAFQGLQWKFADMAMRLEAARLLTYRAAANAAQGRPSRVESSMAKVVAAEAACYVTDEVIQLFGATGMTIETGIEWLYRLARGFRIAGGTSEIHRNMIGKALLEAET